MNIMQILFKPVISWNKAYCFTHDKKKIMQYKEFSKYIKASFLFDTYTKCI